VERKKALIAAGAVSGTLLAASTAFALTGGIVDSGADDGAGSVSPVTTSTIEQILADAPVTPAVVRPTTEPVTTSSASAVAGEEHDGDDLDDDDAYEDDERDSEDESHEDEDEDEYEGAEDDD
jgi:hypothetical protein